MSLCIRSIFTSSHRDVQRLDPRVKRSARGNGQHPMAQELRLQGKSVPFITCRTQTPLRSAHSRCHVPSSLSQAQVLLMLSHHSPTSPTPTKQQPRNTRDELGAFPAIPGPLQPPWPHSPVPAMFPKPSQHTQEITETWSSSASTPHASTHGASGQLPTYTSCCQRHEADEATGLLWHSKSHSPIGSDRLSLFSAEYHQLGATCECRQFNQRLQLISC